MVKILSTKLVIAIVLSLIPFGKSIGQDITHSPSAREIFTTELPKASVLEDFSKRRRSHTEKEEDTVDITGWRYGLNIGFYFGNKNSANFYSGRPGNENTINYIINNKYRYDELRQLINFSDTFFILEYPSQMSYDPAVMVGFIAKYNFTNKMGFFFQFNYVKLKATDFFTAEVDPMQFLTERDIRVYGIVGVEERVNIEMGLSRYLPIGPKMNVFLEGGLNINDSEVKSHEIQIEGQTYDIVNIYGSQNYVPNTSLQSYDVRQGGIGFGAFFTGGVQFSFNENISMDPGISLWWKKINLAGYDSYNAHWAFTVRFLFKDLM